MTLRGIVTALRSVFAGTDEVLGDSRPVFTEMLPFEGKSSGTHHPTASFSRPVFEVVPSPHAGTCVSQGSNAAGVEEAMTIAKDVASSKLG